MKTTDMSKLHLAKRVYWRDETVHDNIKVITINDEDDIYTNLVVYEDGSEITYTKTGLWSDSDNDHLNDIIAFDIDEPLSEERSAYIEKVSREAMGKMRENFGLDLEEKEFVEKIKNSHPQDHSVLLLEKNIQNFIAKSDSDLITMQFNLEDLEEVCRWYDELEHLDDVSLSDKFVEGYTIKAHKLIKRFAAEKDKLK